MPMNKKTIEINLDKKRTLRFDMNAMAEFEDISGKPFFGWAQTMQNMTAKDLRSFLWACLRHEDKELTPEQVGAMITADNLLDVQKSLSDMYVANTPTKEESQSDNAPLVDSSQN